MQSSGEMRATQWGKRGERRRQAGNERRGRPPVLPAPRPLPRPRCHPDFPAAEHTGDTPTPGCCLLTLRAPHSVPGDPMAHKRRSDAQRVNTHVFVPMLSVPKARPARTLPTPASPHSPGSFSGGEEGALDSARVSPAAWPLVGEKAAPERAKAPPGSGASLCWWSRRSVSSIWARVTLLGAAARGALPPLSLESSSSSRRCVSFLRSSCSRRRFSFSSWGEGGDQEWAPPLA